MKEGMGGAALYFILSWLGGMKPLESTLSGLALCRVATGELRLLAGRGGDGTGKLPWRVAVWMVGVEQSAGARRKGTRAVRPHAVLFFFPDADRLPPDDAEVIL